MKERLSCIEFGKRLIALDDLHPEYTLLWKVATRRDNPWSDTRRLRWILAYCLFSHCGAASKLCKKGDWTTFIATAENIKPRGRTRRHFRAANMDQGLDFLRTTFYTPHDVLLSLGGNHDFKALTKTIEQWPQWGPWGSFKLIDMLERLNFIKVRVPFDVKMDPKPMEGVKRSGMTMEELCEKFGSLYAPPRYERHINPLEVETICCKWMSHLKGNYKPGKELIETYEELTGWGKLARDLRSYVVIP